MGLLLRNSLLSVAADSASLRLQAPLKAFLAGLARRSVLLPVTGNRQPGPVSTRKLTRGRQARLYWDAGSVSRPFLPVPDSPVVAVGGAPLAVGWRAAQGSGVERPGGEDMRGWLAAEEKCPDKPCGGHYFFFPLP